MGWIWSLITWFRNAWDWAQFGDALFGALQTKLGISVVTSLSAMLYGAWADATGYQIALMGMGVFVALHAFAMLRTLRVPKSPLVLTLDVRPKTGLHQEGEFYSIVVRNAGKVTLRDVSVRALDSWFTRAIVSTAQTGHPTSSHKPIDLLHLAALHPEAPQAAEMFGLSYGKESTNIDYILNNTQRFAVEVSAQDVPAVLGEFEFNPDGRPMLKLLP